MRKRVIITLVVIVLLFSACNKDKSKEDDTVKTFDPMKTTQPHAGAEANSWWQQYTTQANKSQGTTVKTDTQKPTSGGSNSASKAPSSDSKPTNDTKPTTTEIIDPNNMTYSNVNGGQTKLTKDPSDKYIKKTIAMYANDFGENISSEQLMCFTDTKLDFAVIYVFSSVNGKSASTVQYVLALNTDLSLAFCLKSSDGKVLSFFPYANSGVEKYNVYREQFKSIMDAKDSSMYPSMRDEYSIPFNDPNVKTFLSR